MASLLEAQSALETSVPFRSRVRACIVGETTGWADPPTSGLDVILTDIMPDVAAAPGFAAAYLWGDQPGDVAPGHGAITDGQILATVQPMLDAYRPAP